MPPKNFTFSPSDEMNLVPEEDAIVSTEHEKQPPLRIVWRNVIWLSFLHVGAAYGSFLCFYCKWQTILFAYLLYVVGGIGVTAGAHRLWSHRSYKAKLPLRILLAFLQTTAFQNDIYEWSRDHRAHHKYSETNADPHNARRGFFFSHVGWLLVRKHPEVTEKGKKLSMQDLIDDPVVRFQRKYYIPSMFLLCFILPSWVPTLWNESLWNAYFTCGLLRYAVVLNATWLVNSVAHMWGNRPYDRFINPVESLFVSIGAVGEGFHNYHHTFPHDYATSEFGKLFNLTTIFLDFMYYIGQAYDRKAVPKEVIARQQVRKGDGTTTFYGVLGETTVAVKR